MKNYGSALECNSLKVESTSLGESKLECPLCQVTLGKSFDLFLVSQYLCKMNRMFLVFQLSIAMQQITPKLSG